MNDALTKQLVEKYPLIFKKVKYFEFGDGWFQIIDDLCGRIYAHSRYYENIVADIISGNYEDEDHAHLQASMELNLEEERKKIPVLLQAKEKFGGLRFYIGPAEDKVHAWIQYAEYLASKTCEKCGSRENVSRRGSWIKNYCETHHLEAEAERRARYGDDAEWDNE